MAKILNLASLKAKADAVGVSTTATSTTPNLCPLKINIALYVTNGSSTVSISGSWADNQLVPEDNVTVSKTTTGTTTVYRNVSVGSLQGGGDIPAKGGSSYAYKVVTYEYATQTNFSDGTSSTGSYTSGSTTVNGSTVSANSLGTTTKSRTKIGTSSKTLTVAGTSVSVSADIYQQANQAVSGYPTYRNVNVLSGSASDISAAGGKLRASAIVTYLEASVTVYTSNATSTGTYSGKTATIYGSYVEASNLQTSFKTRTYIGSSTPSGSVAGATRTASAVSIYLAANYITKITPTSSEGHSYHVSYNNIAANGGSSSPTMWGRATYTFSSGSTVTSGSTTPFTNVSATYTRSYGAGLAVNPSGAFSLNNNTGVVTARANSNTSSRTAIIIALLTVSITYTGSYAGVFTACSAGSVTHLPPCTQNAYSPPTTGYDILVNGPHPGTAPILYFYDNSIFRGQAHSRNSFDFSLHNTWNSTGVVNRIYVIENGNQLKYITITGTNGNTILAKTAISNYTYYNLTSNFNTSDYNNGTAIINIAYSNS